MKRTTRKAIKNSKNQRSRLKNQCRCLSGQQQCLSPLVKGTLFCRLHQNCRGSPMSGMEPRYDPGTYNNDPRVQDAHNCFDYSFGVVDDEQTRQCDGKPKPCEPLFHQPGGTKGLSDILQRKEGRTCKVVDQLMREDVPELTPATFERRCPVGKSKIALVVHPGEDYHFYRQDDDGWWSHKDGSNKVKRYDAEGRPIWNPQTAARDYRPKGSFLNYRDFCGFYCTPRRRTIKLAKGGGQRRRQRKSVTPE